VSDVASSTAAADETIPPRKHVVVEGDVASFREAGAGIPVFVTAGLGLTSQFYRDSYGPLARAGIRLLVPDLPGWGDTPGPAAGLEPGETADFLRRFAGALGIRRAYWVGHSVGAQPVVRLAVQRPDLAAGIVLVGPTGAPGRLPRLRQAAGLAVEAFRTSPGVIAAVARDYLRTSPARYLGTWIRHGRESLLDELARVQCPALILVGDADPICPPRAVELMRHRLRQAEVEWVRGGTHALPRGQAEQFNRALIRFVGGTVRQRT
jgi:pimeloyl-ACP methyl ester carboxylesterase